MKIYFFLSKQLIRHFKLIAKIYFPVPAQGINVNFWCNAGSFVAGYKCSDLLFAFTGNINTFLAALYGVVAACFWMYACCFPAFSFCGTGVKGKYCHNYFVKKHSIFFTVTGFTLKKTATFMRWVVGFGRFSFINMADGLLVRRPTKA